MDAKDETVAAERFKTAVTKIKEDRYSKSDNFALQGVVAALSLSAN